MEFSSTTSKHRNDTITLEICYKEVKKITDLKNDVSFEMEKFDLPKNGFWTKIWSQISNIQLVPN